MECPGPVWCFDINPVSSLVATGTGGLVVIFDLRSGETLYSLQVLKDGEYHSDILGVWFSPDGKLLAIAADDSLLRVWDYTSITGKSLRIGSGHSLEVCDVCYAPNGKSIATASEDKTARLWCEGQDYKTMATALVLTEPTTLGTILVTHDSLHVITGSTDGSCRIYNAHTGALVHQIAEHEKSVCGVAVSSDGGVNGVALASESKLVFSCSADGSVICWDVKTSVPQDILAEHRGIVMEVAVARTQPCLVTVGYDGSVCVWRYTI